MPDETKRLAVDLNREDHRRLRQLAVDADLPVAALVRALVSGVIQDGPGVDQHQILEVARQG